MKKIIFFGFLLLIPNLGQALGQGNVDFIFEENAAVPIVNVSVAFRMGTALDPKDHSGLAQFMGGMLMRGTLLRSKTQLENQLDEIGSTMGVDVGSERTVIRGSVLSSQLKPFLDLISEIILKPSFPESEIKKLKAETISALLARRGDDSALARLHFNRFFYGDHPYGKSQFGTIASVKKFSRTDLVQLYHSMLSRNGLIVAATGDAQPAELHAWAERLYSLLPDTQVKIQTTTPVAPTHRRVLIVEKPDRTQVPLIVGQTGIRLGDPDFFPLYIGNHIFGGSSFFARLLDEIRTQRGWSYGAFSRFQYGVQPRDWTFTYSPATKDAALALKHGLRMAEILKADGITQNEFNFSKESLINGAGFLYNTPEKRVENALTEKVFKLKPGFFKDYAQSISQVTLKDVNTTLKAFLKPETFTVTAVGSAKDLRKPLADAAGIPESEVVVKSYLSED